MKNYKKISASCSVSFVLNKLKNEETILKEIFSSIEDYCYSIKGPICDYPILQNSN